MKGGSLDSDWLRHSNIWLTLVASPRGRSLLDSTIITRFLWQSAEIMGGGAFWGFFVVTFCLAVHEPLRVTVMDAESESSLNRL